jgi:ABC-type branched-subunit amino acid transport system ATPase component/predicted MFS family arabinose efflux permease
LHRFFKFLQDQPVFPLLILTVLNAVDEFDRAAFIVLAPEIRSSFHLSNSAFGAVVGLTTVVILLGGLPVGFYGDRLPRTKMVIVAGLLWSAMSVTTGIAPVLLVLVLSRFFSGTGRVMNEAIHTSLLTDYYPQHIQGRVFGTHRLGSPLGNIPAPILAGIVAGVAGNWRWAFFAAIVPTIIALLFATRLKEPTRGATEDSAMAAEASKEKPIPFARGWRWLYSVPSLKRLYVSSFFGGGVIFALVPFLALYFNDVWGIQEVGRGLIGGGNGFSQLVGAVAGGIIADRLRRRGLGKIAFVAATSVGILGVGVLIVGVAPTLAIAIAGSWLANLGIGLWLAPNASVLVVVLPARIRSLGIGIGVMLFGAGGFVFSIVAGGIADASGIKAAIGTLAPIVFLASAVYMAASRFVSADGERALQALALEVELRHERLTAGSQALLVCRGIDVAYDKVQVLFGVDFQVQKGEIVALLGTNGAGKSTLLKAISGAVHPVGGAVFFEGENITFYEPHESAAAGIVQVPGGRGIFPSLTVAENLSTAAWLFRREAEYVKKSTDEALRLFPVLEQRKEQKAGDLSGGEQQMLTLAQAFIARPKLLMIDELTLGLAPILVEQLLEAIKEFHRRGTTIILVEQSVNLALQVAQRAYFMEKGEIRFSGEAQDLTDRGDLLRSVFLEGASRGGDGKVRAAQPRVPAISSNGHKVLSVSELTKSYGGVHAVNGVSFDLNDGQILGIIGPNGAGKTTVFDLISGFLPVDSGRIYLTGEDITYLSPEGRSARGLGRSFQDARLFPSLTVKENLFVALDRHLEVKDPVAAALSLPSMRGSEATAERRVNELISLMHLDAFRDKFVSELSTGSRRIVDITCALAHQPKVLILDEPSSGIAQAETEVLGPLLERVRDDLGCSLLVIEHDIPLVSSLADELIALDLGRVIAQGLPTDVVRDKAVITAYLGTQEGAIARSGRAKKEPGGAKKGSARAKTAKKSG